MSSDLYQELDISRDATPEQIRKAYKKRALKTHPDRLPVGATPDEKTASEEMFRRVNNAYEVLSDPKKRTEYDTHGVWPPPEEDEIPAHSPHTSHHNRSYTRSRHPSRSQTFPDPFFSHLHTPFSPFQFTDPFMLFNSIFEGSPFTATSSRSRHPPFTRPIDPFHMERIQAEIEGFMDDIDRDPFGRTGFPLFGPMPSMARVGSSSFHNSNSGRWISDSFMTSTVNGVTQTIRKRTDVDGNEHVSRTFPDGREVRTINGIEQPPAGYLPYADPAKSRRIGTFSGHRYRGHSSDSHKVVPSSSRMDYGAVPPPPYPAAYHDANFDQHRRPRRNSEKYAQPSSANLDPYLYEDRYRRKKWW